MKVPFVSLETMHTEIAGEMQQAFTDVYNANWFILGKQVEAFEQEYSAFNKVKHTVGLSNGLDALRLALESLGVKPGDEVIVPANTYIATVLAISSVGAKPVFAEPNESTYNLDPGTLDSVITSRTKCIIPVHLYGQACEMGSIMQIADGRNIAVLEDNAQSHAATFNGKLTGSFGKINATSFYPGKNLGALGDAGAITTNDDELARKVSILRNYGSEVKYVHEERGYNMRLDEMQAAFLRIKLKHIGKWTAERVLVADLYNKRLAGIGDLKLPVLAKNASHVYHIYAVRTTRRDALKDFLVENGVGCLIHYPTPPHLQKAFTNLGYSKGDFPISEQLAETTLSLPIWPGMTGSNVDHVGTVIEKFFAGNGGKN